MEKRSIRFSELVKKSGQPEMVTLWTKPKDNHGFMQAVKKNRVLTLIEEPAGTRKDFGRIGFHQQPYALYLVFPKPLPKDPKARVVGIKYEAVADPEVTNPIPLKDLKAPRRVAKPPLKKRFEVTIRRKATVETSRTITAENEAKAKVQACETVAQEAFDPSEAEVQ